MEIAAALALLQENSLSYRAGYWCGTILIFGLIAWIVYGLIRLLFKRK